MYNAGASLDFAVDASNKLSLAANYNTSGNILRVPTGSASDPSITFTGDENTGFYNTSADNISVTTNGTQRMTISNLSVALKNGEVLRIADGTASAPGLNFDNDQNTGIYSVGADNLGISTGGTLRLDVETTKIDSTLPITAPNVSNGFATTASSATPITLTVASKGVQEITGTSDQTVILPSATTLTLGHTFTIIVAASADIILTVQDNGLNTLLTSSDASAQKFSVVLTAQADANGTWDFYNTSSSFPAANDAVVTNSASQVLLAAGSAGTPTYSFSGDPDSGMYSPSGGSVAISTNGSVRATFSSAATTIASTSLRANAGSAATPGYAFSGTEVDAGMYSLGTDNIGFATAGTLRRDISAAAETFTLPQLGPAGSVTAPTYSFSGAESNSGMYQSGSDTIRFAAGGVNAVSISDTNLTMVAGRIQLNAGTLAAPGINFGNVSSDTDTGLYRIAANNMGVASGGVASMDWTSTAVNAPLPIVHAVGAVGAPSITFDSDPNTGLYWVGADSIGVTTGGTQRLSVSNTDIIGTVRFVAPAGSAASASYVFSGDGSTGFYSTGAGNINMTTSGTLRKTLGTTVETSTLLQRGADGSAAAPSYSFSSDPNTGIYWIGADDVGVATGGTLKFDVSTTAVTSTLPIVAPLGAVGAPGLTFAGDTNTGIYCNGSGIIQFACNGSNEFYISAARMSCGAPMGLSSYTVAGVPAGEAGDMIFVTNDAGSPAAIPAYYDGSSWRRVDTAAVLS